MISVFKYPSEAARRRMAKVVGRGLAAKQKDLKAVSRILADVRKNGDEALVRYTNQFDAPGLTADDLCVTESEFSAAKSSVSRAFMRALNRAVRQIEGFHRQQLPKSWMDPNRPGTILGQRICALDAAGIYVPGGMGGKTPLVSSVLMGAIPAKIAGVRRICMASPPTRKGGINAHLLVAAKKVGVDRVFKVGSAWAIGAMAYGTQTVPKVNIIVGPGNIYVTLAKKIVSGTTGIDMIAGPSEILIIADTFADPAFIAADLLSQAEHDPLASSILVTNSTQLAKAVKDQVARQLSALPRREIAEASLKSFGAILVVADLATAIDLANQAAPEHLELQMQDPFEYIGMIRNAGAVFLGPYTPEPMGDYIAGPNHVLPTAGTARFSSALSVDHFIKKISLIHYSREAFCREAKDVIQLAEIEGLKAHARAVGIRLEKK
jgi:histidinol dehydrogenase